MNETLERILFYRKNVIIDKCNSTVDAQESALINAYLFGNFGLKADKPERVSMANLGIIADAFNLRIPSSFYANPQDMSYYSRDELLTTQLISYFFAYGADCSRIEVFDDRTKDYIIGREAIVRTFKVLTEEEAEDELKAIANSLVNSTRPWTKRAVRFLLIYIMNTILILRS